MSNNSRISAGLLVALAIVLGRVFGLVRDILLAHSFGSSTAADWTVLLLSFPDLIVNLLLGGAVAAVLIPEWAGRSPDDRGRLYQRALLTVAFTFGMFAAVIWLARRPVYSILAPGLSMDLEQQGSVAFAVMLFAIPLTSLSSVTSAYANVKGSYFLPALGTCILNGAVIIGLLLSGRSSEPLVLIGASITFGALFRLLMQLATVHFAGPFMADKEAGPAEYLRPSSSKNLFIHYVNALIASSLLLLLPVVARSFASAFGTGYLALFNYAQKLADVPIGIIVTTIATLLLPQLSRLLAKAGDLSAARVAFDMAVRFSVTASVAVVIPGVFFAEPIVTLLLSGRSLTIADLNIIADLLKINVLSFPFQAIVTILMLSFSSLKDNRTPAMACLIGVAVLPLLIIFLVPYFGILGIAYALISSLGIVALIMALELEHRISFNLLVTLFNKSFLRTSALGAMIITGLCLLGRELVGASSLPQVIYAIVSAACVLLFMLFLDKNYKDAFCSWKGTKA